MIALTVVDHDHVDLVQTDFLFKIVDKNVAVRGPDRVDQDRLLLFDKVSVLTGAALGVVLMAVEGLQLPIHITDPAYIVFYVPAHDCSPLQRPESRLLTDVIISDCSPPAHTGADIDKKKKKR